MLPHKSDWSQFFLSNKNHLNSLAVSSFIHWNYVLQIIFRILSLSLLNVKKITASGPSAKPNLFWFDQQIDSLISFYTWFLRRHLVARKWCRNVTLFHVKLNLSSIQNNDCISFALLLICFWFALILLWVISCGCNWKVQYWILRMLITINYYYRTGSAKHSSYSYSLVPSALGCNCMSSCIAKPSFVIIIYCN